MHGTGSPNRTRPCRMNRWIKMSETWALILALLAGTLLGMTFFGGLWWTIRRGMSSQQPAALFFFSLLLRTGIALAGFILLRVVIGGECCHACLDFSWPASWSLGEPVCRLQTRRGLRLSVKYAGKSHIRSADSVAARLCENQRNNRHDVGDDDGDVVGRKVDHTQA